MLLILTILALCIPNALCQVQQSAIQVRLTSNGLNYAGQKAMEILTKELPKIQIPTIQDGDITASNIHITQFTPPSAHVDMQAPAIFTWTLNGASIDLTAHVHACKTIVFKICGDVDAEMVATGVNIRVTTVLGRKPEDSKRPYILTAAAEISISNLKLKTSGGVLGWVLDLFTGIIAPVVKPEIEKAVAAELAPMLSTQVNALIATLAVDKVINGTYDLDYGMVNDPLVVNGHLNLDIKGGITCPKKPSLVSPYPYTPLAQNIPQDSRMLYALISDKVINDALFFAHQMNQTQYLVTQDTPEVGPYLKLHCDKGICLGKYVPNVDQLYPNVPAAVNLVKTAVPPTLRVNADGTASFYANITSDLYAPISTRNSSILLANLYLNAKVVAEFNNSKLVGRVNMSDIGLDIVESQLDPRIIEALKYYLNPMIKPLLEQEINKIFGAGVELPSIDGATLSNPAIALLDRTVQIESDIIYNFPGQI